MNSFKTLTVHSWDEIVHVVGEARLILNTGDDEECFFRGHSDRTFPLLPTLQRISAEHNWPEEEMLNKEDAFFWEFQARAHDLHGLQFDDWDYLFAMRHHGIPTRLLDWTESLAVALYFAVEPASASPAGHPCVWVLNPYALNQKEWGRDLVAPRYLGWDAREETFYTYGDLIVERLIDWKRPVAVYPMQRLARMRAQRGWFTIHGTDRRAIESIAPKCVVRIDFDGHSVQETRDLLDLLGFDRFTIFTDLDSLAESVTKKNLLLLKSRMVSKNGRQYRKHSYIRRTRRRRM